MKRLRWVAYALFLVLCVGVGYFARVAGNVLTSFGGVGNLWGGISNPRGQFPGKKSTTILLIGEDYNRDRLGKVERLRSRSDTIMMLSVDFDKASIRACSVPRDTYVRAPDGKSGKINGTFARGGEDLLERTLEDLFGVTIDYYVVVKPDAVREIVDAVGGVDVEAIDDMKYKDTWGGLDIDIPKGRSHLDGKRAEGYVRFREVNRYRITDSGAMVPIRGVKGSQEEGDIRRTARQQLLIQSLVSSALKPTNLGKAPEIIDTGFAQIETNLSRTQILALATILRGEQGDMLSATVPGSDSTRGGAYYYQLDDDRAKAMVDWLIKGNEASVRDLVRVSVVNASGKRALAKDARDKLRELGYNVRSGGTDEKTPQSSVIYSKTAYKGVATEIARTIGAASVTKSPVLVHDWEPEIKVVVGSGGP